MKKAGLFILIGLAVLLYCCEESIEDEFETTPKILEGRVWEPGIYYNYNTLGEQKVFEIRSNLDTVKYFMGETYGFFMQMEYGNNTLIGYGNWYDDLHNNPPTDPQASYDYRNRITSPGFVFDYNDTTFIGYYNYYKKEGEIGKLKGLYESYLYYDKKLVGEAPEIQFVFKDQILISEPNESGNFPFIHTSFNNDGSSVVLDENVIFKEDVENENIMLIRFQNTDYIFIKTYDIPSSIYEAYFHPGLFAFKVNDI